MKDNVLRKSFAGMIGVLLFLLFWQVAVQWFEIQSFILPPPTAIFMEMFHSFAFMIDHLFMTLAEAILGLFIALILAVGISILMHFIDVLHHALYPLIVASQMIPIIAISPLFLIWFDYSIWSKVAVVVLWCFFPIVIGLSQGLRTVSAEWKLMFRSLNATKWQMFRYLEWPSEMPSFFTGLQMAAAFSVIAATVGEWLGAEQGLGFIARRASANLQTELLFVAVLLLCLMGVLLFMLVRWISQYVIFWQDKI